MINLDNSIVKFGIKDEYYLYIFDAAFFFSKNLFLSPGIFFPDKFKTIGAHAD